MSVALQDIKLKVENRLCFGWFLPCTFKKRSRRFCMCRPSIRGQGHWGEEIHFDKLLPEISLHVPSKLKDVRTAPQPDTTLASASVSHANPRAWMGMDFFKSVQNLSKTCVLATDACLVGKLLLTRSLVNSRLYTMVHLRHMSHALPSFVAIPHSRAGCTSLA